MNSQSGWSVPVNQREIVDERGDPTFQFIALPKSGLVPGESIVIEDSPSALVLPPDILRRKEDLIAQRKTVLEKRHADAMTKWIQNGSQGEPPAPALFHDAHLLRVLPEDVSLRRDSDGIEQLVLQASKTTYFDYAVTRSGELPKEHMAMPLACCGAIQIQDEMGKRYALMTIRTERVEVYPHCLHVVGGMISRDDPSKSATDWWLEEVRQETGVRPDEVEMQGCLGVALDTHLPHTELLYLGTMRPKLEELFERKEESNEVIPKRKTDKEVRFIAIPMTPESIEALVTGESVNGSSDTRPWVPTGLANMLLAGKHWFGSNERWYQETVSRYREKIATLLTRTINTDVV